MDDGHDQSQQRSQMLASPVNKEDHMTHWYGNFFFFQLSTTWDFWCLIPKSQRLVHSRSHSSSLEIFGVLYPDFTDRDFSFNLPKSQRLVHSRSHSSLLEIFGVLYPDFNNRDFKLYTYPNLRDWYTLAHICLRLKILVSYTQISTIVTSSYTLSIFHLGSSVASSCLLVVSFIIIEANHFTAGLPSVPLSHLCLWSLVSYTQISAIATHLNHCAASHSPL